MNFSDSTYTSVVGVNVENRAETPLTSQRWPIQEAIYGFGRLAWLSDNSGLIGTVAEPGRGLPQLWHLSYPQGVARKITADLNDYADVSLTANSETLAAVRFERLINIWIAPGGDAKRVKPITSGSGREDGREQAVQSAGKADSGL
jgi:hypothetical protein